MIPLEVRNPDLVDSLQIRVLNGEGLSSVAPRESNQEPPDIFRNLLVAFSKYALDLNNLQKQLEVVAPNLDQAQQESLRKELVALGLSKLADEYLPKQVLGDQRYF